ncbi:hypothetical protein ACJJTC_019849 [Scirpophaga incertulas]
MASVRTCLCLLLVISYKFTTAEPTFGTRIWCNLFCEDGDDSDDDDDSDYDLFDIFDPCAGCPSTSSGGTTTKAPNTQKPVNIMIRVNCEKCSESRTNELRGFLSFYHPSTTSKLETAPHDSMPHDCTAIGLDAFVCLVTSL